MEDLTHFGRAPMIRRDAQGRTAAQRCVDLGKEFPYDGRRPERDWAHRAARGILYDLGDRGGIKHELREVEADVRPDIVDAIAEIIREADRERDPSRPTRAQSRILCFLFEHCSMGLCSLIELETVRLLQTGDALAVPAMVARGWLMEMEGAKYVALTYDGHILAETIIRQECGEP